jgi:hypothetical protein
VWDEKSPDILIALDGYRRETFLRQYVQFILFLLDLQVNERLNSLSGFFVLVVYTVYSIHVPRHIALRCAAKEIKG